MMEDFVSKLKNAWPFVLAFIAILSWIVSQAVTASDFQGKVSRNEENIESVSNNVDKVSGDVGVHEKEGVHPQLNEKLIRLETDVNHIKIHQSTNFSEIKDTLNIMQQDIKEMNRRSHRHR